MGNMKPSLKMKSKAEVGDSCNSCYMDILAAAGSCYNDADFVQCIIDTVGEDCVTCICEFLDVDCQEDLEKKVLLNMRPSLKMKSKAEVGDSCDSCYMDILDAAGSCYNEADFTQCIIDKVKGDCATCICEFLGVDCQEDFFRRASYINTDVVGTCMECGFDVEQVVQDCISAGGAEEIVKCFVEDFPKIETCVDCICDILASVGIDCEEQRNCPWFETFRNYYN